MTEILALLLASNAILLVWLIVVSTKAAYHLAVLAKPYKGSLLKEEESIRRALIRIGEHEELATVKEILRAPHHHVYPEHTEPTKSSLVRKVVAGVQTHWSQHRKLA